MGKKKGCQDCPDTGRDMSRGEFLKTSAVAAGGVAVGGGLEARERSPGAFSERDARARCVDLEHKWAIPAGLLNIFWADIYPRLVALHWFDQTQDVLKGDMTVTDLKNSIDRLSKKPNSEFERRCELFKRYLDWPHHIPITVRGSGAYDFVITSGIPTGNQDEGGIELFIPRKPKDAADLMRYFSFRRTGRPALGVPDYLDGPYSGVSIDAPTGPNRLTLSQWATNWVQASGCISYETVSPTATAASGDTRTPSLLALDPDSSRVIEERPIQEERPAQIRDIHAYKCLGKDRCWQIEGAVYRGLVTEVARIVAIIWFEELSEQRKLAELAQLPGGQTIVNCATTSGVNVQTVWSQLGRRYKDMFADSGDHGLRMIFQERLELTLPSAEEMAAALYPSSVAGSGFNAFKFTDGTVMNPVTGLPSPREESLAEDVIITRKGFFFPPLPAMNKTIDQLCDDLAHGRAGNPVFTSSERTLLF